MRHESRRVARLVAIPSIRLPIVALACALAGAAGCSGERDDATRRPLPLPIRVAADAGRTVRLSTRPRSAPAMARAWMARVTPATSLGPASVLPDAPPETPPEAPMPPALEIDPGLDPPIAKRPAPFVVPEAWRGRRGQPESVDLDVLIDEEGRVADVECAAGCEDSLVVQAARLSALAMTFYPARRGGWPIAVWCRQRFVLGSR